MLRLLSRFYAVNLFVCLLMAVSLNASPSVLNLNHDMELGQVGPGVPGYRLIANRVLREFADKQLDKMYLPQTVKTQDGQCLKIPGYTGMNAFQMELADMYIRQDCEIKISFKAKIGPDENGVLQPVSRHLIDFRCMPNPLAGEKYYPMLKAYGYKPTEQWKIFSVTYSVKAQSNFYMLWFLGSVPPDQQNQNALFLDDIKVERIDIKPNVKEQAAVIPDQFEAAYEHGQTLTLDIKASLQSQEPSVTASVKVIGEADGSIMVFKSVTLKKVKELDSHRSLYTAKLQSKASRFGSFYTSVDLADKSLEIVGGNFSVLHPTIKHPRMTPGWSIGYNKGSVCPIGRSGGVFDYVDYRFVSTGSIEREYRIAKQAGMSLQRLWGHWRFLEPSKDHWQADILDPYIKLNKKYDIETLFVLAGNLTVQGGQEWIQSKIKKGRLTWPKYLLQYHYDQNGRGSLHIPDKIMGKYLDFVIKKWGDQIDYWELFNEPGIGGFPARNYLGYLKQTYSKVKKHDSNDVLLGNGVTGDFGMNVVKWCEALNAVDSDYPTYLDGIAFHPYAVAMDYQQGHYGLYTKCVSDIRSKLKIQKPLWNTECYYLIDAVKPQIPFGMNLSQYGADEIQRHLIEGMLNGVVGAASANNGSLVRRDAPVTVPALSESAVGTNALSWLLKDMQKVRSVSTNKYISSGIFTGSSAGHALGFVYDQRPAGSFWHLPENDKGVKVLDLFGNPMPTDQKIIRLSYEPHYLVGDPKIIAQMLDAKNIVSKQSLKLIARSFKNDLYISVSNLSGVMNCTFPIAIEPTQGLRMPEKLQVNFNQNKQRETIVVQQAITPEFDRSKPINWQQTSNQYAQQKQSIDLLPNTDCYTIPMQGQPPLLLKLSKGSQVQISADSQAMHIHIAVQDSKIIQATKDDLWRGDALELFIDPLPMQKLDRDEQVRGDQAIDLWQYIFAVKPSLTNINQRTTNVKRGKFKSNATHTVEITKDGYTLHAIIPWQDILSGGNLGQIMGMDIEIDHANGSKVVKESLSKMPGQSFKRRLHYPLFEIPVQIVKEHQGLIQQSSVQAKESASSLRIDMTSKGNQISFEFIEGSKQVQGKYAQWLKDNKGKRLMITMPATQQWQEHTFTFIPKKDGVVSFNLMSGYDGKTKTWCCVDHVQILQGATIHNGSFELINKNKLPEQWSIMQVPIYIRDVVGAADGQYYVKVHHDNRFIQRIDVKKDEPVTIRLMAKTPGTISYFRNVH